VCYEFFHTSQVKIVLEIYNVLEQAWRDPDVKFDFKICHNLLWHSRNGL
jgi:hypothetical protein